MGSLTYSLNVSLDGYVETPDHSLDWAVVDDELHTWFNDQARQPMREFARFWNAARTIVFSSGPLTLMCYHVRHG